MKSFAAVMILTSILLMSGANAAPEESKPTSLKIDSEVFTRESIVEVGGRKYRKVEFKNQVVYLQLLSEETTGADLQLLCEREGVSAFQGQPQLVLASVKVTRRSSLFVEGLQQVCSDSRGGKKRITLDPAIHVGFLFHDRNEDKALLRNKRVFINPFGSGIGFKADW